MKVHAASAAVLAEVIETVHNLLASAMLSMEARGITPMDNKLTHQHHRPQIYILKCDHDVASYSASYHAFHGNNKTGPDFLLVRKQGSLV